MLPAVCRCVNAKRQRMRYLLSLVSWFIPCLLVHWAAVLPPLLFPAAPVVYLCGLATRTPLLLGLLLLGLLLLLLLLAAPQCLRPGLPRHSHPPHEG
jgi:hypothetical protein